MAGTLEEIHKKREERKTQESISKGKVTFSEKNVSCDILLQPNLLLITISLRNLLKKQFDPIKCTKLKQFLESQFLNLFSQSSLTRVGNCYRVTQKIVPNAWSNRDQSHQFYNLMAHVEPKAEGVAYKTRKSRRMETTLSNMICQMVQNLITIIWTSFRHPKRMARQKSWSNGLHLIRIQYSTTTTELAEFKIDQRSPIKDCT